MKRHPEGLESFGVHVLGGVGEELLGDVYFVGSTVPGASDATGWGWNKVQPFATMDYAVGKCTANNGDLVIVMPGHVETVAAASGLDIDVAGVTFVGLGHGTARPTINFSATASTMTIAAASTTLRNFLFEPTIDAVVTPVVITAADCRLIDVEVTHATLIQSLDFFSPSAAAHRLLFDGLRYYVPGSGAQSVINIGGAADGITIRNFWIHGSLAVAAIENATACTNLTIGGPGTTNFVHQTHATANALCDLTATTTGSIGPNVYLRQTAANIIGCTDFDDMQVFLPVAICNADGEVGATTGFTESTDA